MKAKEFVTNLNERLKKSVGNDFLIGKMKISHQLHPTSFKDELSSLINNFKMDGIVIGKITFFDKYKITEKYLLFAEIEMDLLGISRETQKVVLIDHDSPDHVMLHCCMNGNSFVALLNSYSKFVLDKIDGIKFQIDLPQLYGIAGGKEYKQFVDFIFED